MTNSQFTDMAYRTQCSPEFSRFHFYVVGCRKGHLLCMTTLLRCGKGISLTTQGTSPFKKEEVEGPPRAESSLLSCKISHTVAHYRDKKRNYSWWKDL
jgi:hypothetical protein